VYNGRFYCFSRASVLNAAYVFEHYYIFSSYALLCGLKTNGASLRYDTFDDDDTRRQEGRRSSQVIGSLLLLAFLLVKWRL
jgi:hypothetical protein